MKYSNIDALHESSARALPVGRERASELEPVLVRDLPGGDRDEARQPRLGGQRVVVRRVEPSVGDAEADREEPPLRGRTGTRTPSPRRGRRRAPPRRVARSISSSARRVTARSTRGADARRRVPRARQRLRHPVHEPVRLIVAPGPELRRRTLDRAPTARSAGDPRAAGRGRPRRDRATGRPPRRASPRRAASPRPRARATARRSPRCDRRAFEQQRARRQRAPAAPPAWRADVGELRRETRPAADAVRRSRPSRLSSHSAWRRRCRRARGVDDRPDRAISGSPCFSVSR